MEEQNYGKDKIKMVNNLINEFLLEKLAYLEERNKTHEEIFKKCHQNKDSIISLINQTKILYNKIEESKNKHDARDKSNAGTAGRSKVAVSRGVSSNATKTPKNEINNTINNITNVKNSFTSNVTANKSKTKLNLTSTDIKEIKEFDAKSSNSKATPINREKTKEKIRDKSNGLNISSSAIGVGIKKLSIGNGNEKLVKKEQVIPERVGRNITPSASDNKNFENLKRSKTKPKLQEESKILI